MLANDATSEFFNKKIADQNWWFFNSENFKEPEHAVS
jgi:hypothetical protein